MDNHLLGLFQREVGRQCRFALLAAGDVNGAMKPGDDLRLWYSLQALLVAVANLSKLLFPDPKPRTNDLVPGRGEQLRKSLDVADDSVFASKDCREFRNDLEHFDERLESWVEEDPRRNFVDECVLSKGAIAGLDAASFQRNLDPRTGAFTFRGREYELGPVLEAAQELLARVEAANKEREDARFRRVPSHVPNAAHSGATERN